LKAISVNFPSRRALLSGLGALVSMSSAKSATSPVLDAPPLFRTARSQFTLIEPAVALSPTRIQRIDGKLVDLSLFRSKAILVNFWATWCPSCARELPLLQRLSEIVPTEPLEIVAVSIDSSGPDLVKRFLRRLQIEQLPIYLDPEGRLARNVDGEGTAPFVLYWMPISYLVDRYGRIAGYLVGEADWSSAEGLKLLRYYTTA
jgi:thiol-disulfide isomerase/thioredoxin